MMISDEQVRRALESMHDLTQHPAPPSGRADIHISDELMAKVRRALDAMPEVREDRVVEARALIAMDVLTARDVADRMIGRCIADHVR